MIKVAQRSKGCGCLEKHTRFVDHVISVFRNSEKLIRGLSKLSLVSQITGI